jgi:hypothetical protein
MMKRLQNCVVAKHFRGALLCSGVPEPRAEHAPLRENELAGIALNQCGFDH